MGSLNFGSFADRGAEFGTYESEEIMLPSRSYVEPNPSYNA